MGRPRAQLSPTVATTNPRTAYAASAGRASTVLVAAALLSGACDKPEVPPAYVPEGPAAKTAPNGTAAGQADPQSPLDALLDELARCELHFECEVYQPLVDRGDEATEALVAFAVSAEQPTKARQVALRALREIADPDAGMPLIRAARKRRELPLLADLFEAAGAGRGDKAFAALTDYYRSKDGALYTVQIRRGLSAYGKRAFEWAADELTSADADAAALADIVSDTATEAEADRVGKLLATTKDRLARHRLAATAIRLGDGAQFSVLINGLKAKNQFDRADAALRLATVVEKLGEKRRAAVVGLLKKARKRDKSGVTTGYDKALAALQTSGATPAPNSPVRKSDDE